MYNRKTQTILILSALLLSAFTLPSFSPARVHGAGALSVTPASMFPTGIPATAVGTTVTFQVQVTGIDSFNGWDISVQADPGTLTGGSISVSSALAGISPTVLISCVEGIGTGCAISDGPGVAHSAVAFTTPTAAGVSGTLFAVTYTVGFGPGSIIAPFNDVIASAGVAVSHSTGRAQIGIPNPGFIVDVSPAVDQNGAPLRSGTEGTSVITLTSVGGLSDIVALSLGPITPANSGISDFVAPTSVVLPAGGSAAATISVSVPFSTPPGTYVQTLTAFAQGFGITKTKDVAITVGAGESVRITCGVDFSVVQGTTAVSAIKVKSIFGFFGPVFLSASVSPTANAPTVTTDLSTFSLALGKIQNAILYVSTSTSTAVGSYTVMVNANFGSGTKTCTVNVTVLTVGSPDFTMSSSDTSIIAIRQVTYKTTITVGALNGLLTPILTQGTFSATSCTLSPALTGANGNLAAECSVDYTQAVFTPTMPITGTYSGDAAHGANPTSLRVKGTGCTVNSLPAYLQTAHCTVRVEDTNTDDAGNPFGQVTPTGTVSFVSQGAVAEEPLLDKGPFITISQVSNGLATLTFKTKSNTQLTTYTVTVIAQSGSQTHAVTVTYVLEDFGIQARGSHNFPEFDLTATQCETGKLSFGSLNGFSGTVTITRFRLINNFFSDNPTVGFPSGVSFSFDNTANGGAVYTADATHNDILGVSVFIPAGRFVAGPLTICTTADSPGGEYRLQIRGTTIVAGVKVTNVKNIFVQLNSFDLVPDTSFVVVRQKTTAQVGISVVGSFMQDLCCTGGFGTLAFTDFVALSVTSITPDPALTTTKLTVSIKPGPFFATDLVNPRTPLNITVGPGGEGGLFSVTVTGVALGTPALQRSTTILVSVPSTIVQLPSLTFNDPVVGGTQAFTATVLNTATTTQYAQVLCSGVSTTGTRFFSVQSAVVAVAAGATITIGFTQTFSVQDSGLNFSFLCRVSFGSAPDQLLFISKDKGKGTFTVS